MKEVIGPILAGIPIDMVGGTSMGSFVGATYAEYGDVTKMCQKVRDWSLVSTILLFIFSWAVKKEIVIPAFVVFFNQRELRFAQMSLLCSQG